LTVLSFESFKNFLFFLLLKISQHFCVPVNNNRLGATENLSVIVAADKCAPEASLISTTEKKEIKNKKNWKMEKKIGNLDCQSQTTSPQTLLAWKEILKWVSKIKPCEKVLRNF